MVLYKCFKGNFFELSVSCLLNLKNNLKIKQHCGVREPTTDFYLFFPIFFFLSIFSKLEKIVFERIFYKKVLEKYFFLEFLNFLKIFHKIFS